jgi:hypothetical protein
MTTSIPTRTEINCTTGEVKDVPLTAEEIAQREQMFLENSNRIAEEQAAAEALEALKVSARAKLVSGQPLTEEEAAVLVI